MEQALSHTLIKESIIIYSCFIGGEILYGHIYFNSLVASL